jgi:hypothetical protein
VSVFEMRLPGLRLSRATLLGALSMRRCVFSAPVRLSETTIHGDLDFHGAELLAGMDVRAVRRLGDRTNFSQIRWCGTAELFHDTTFQDATFTGHTAFRDAVFEGEATFAGSEAFGGLDFTAATFEKDVDITGLTASRGVTADRSPFRWSRRHIIAEERMWRETRPRGKD